MEAFRGKFLTVSLSILNRKTYQRQILDYRSSVMHYNEFNNNYKWCTRKPWCHGVHHGQGEIWPDFLEKDDHYRAHDSLGVGAETQDEKIEDLKSTNSPYHCSLVAEFSVLGAGLKK